VKTTASKWFHKYCGKHQEDAFEMRSHSIHTPGMPDRFLAGPGQPSGRFEQPLKPAFTTARGIALKVDTSRMGFDLPQDTVRLQPWV
jgi:hypothetical protein